MSEKVNEAVAYMKQVLVLPDQVQIHLDTFDDRETAEEAAALFQGETSLNFEGLVVLENDGTFKVWVRTEEKDVTPTELTKAVLSYLTRRVMRLYSIENRDKFMPGDRIRIYDVGCYGGLSGTFVGYSADSTIVQLDELGEGELHLNNQMVEPE